MSTGSSEPSPDDVARRADDEWAERASGYIERSLLIVIGATVTVVAGFLSQVWSSASVAYRTDLAYNLQAVSLLFTTAFSLPALRFAVERYKHRNSERSGRAYTLWCVIAVAIFMFYVRLVDQLGDIVLKYAKLPV